MHTRNHQNKTYGFVRTTKNIGTTEIELLLIYEDSREMAKWYKEAENTVECQLKPVKKKHENSMILKSSKLYLESVGTRLVESYETLEMTKQNIYMSSEKEVVLEENKLNRVSRSSYLLPSINEAFSIKILKQTLKGIKIYKWILLVFVLNI